MPSVEITPPAAERNGLSGRGFANVEAILPKISAQVAERTKTSDFKIDLATAENCLIRAEVIEIYKNAIQGGLISSVGCGGKLLFGPARSL